MIKLAKSSFYREAETKQELVEFVMGAKSFSMGSECFRFEEGFAKKQDRKFAIFVSNGSMANLLLIQALLNLGRLKRGDRVGFSALTWPTNVMPIIQLGLVPVPVDCELETLNVSVRTLQAVAGDLQALFTTNVLGFCDQLKDIAGYCASRNIILLEDNCESLGSRAFGKLLGNFSLASTFSFFVGHHLSTIEGGMICTDDERFYSMAVLCRAHGWDRDLPEKYRLELRKDFQVSDFYAKYTFYDLAFNGRPTEIAGFLGNRQLNYWDEIVEKRAKNYGLFAGLMAKNSDFYPQSFKHMEVISNFAVPVVCKSPGLLMKYRKKFEQEKVEIRPIIAGDMLKQPFYKKYRGVAEACCLNAELVNDCGFYFPNNAELDETEIAVLADLLAT